MCFREKKVPHSHGQEDYVQGVKTLHSRGTSGWASCLFFELFPFISPEMKPEKHTIKAWVLLAPRQKPCLVHVVRLPSEHSARDNTGSRRDKTKRMVPFLGPASL